MNIVISLGITFLLVFSAERLFTYRVPGLAVIVTYLVVYWTVEYWRKRGAADETEPDPDYSYLPTSGPIGRFGQGGLLVAWSVTNLLSIFNPFQLVQVIRQLAGNLRLQARERKTGDDGTGYRTRVAYRLPFRGEWFLCNGGMTPKTSHSWDVLGQRFAMDFVKVNGEYRRHVDSGTKPEDYFCYGEDILAAADGTVVATENRINTAPLPGWGVCDFTARNFIGNYVLIRHADGEYGLYAHLIRDSIPVQPGDTVVQGQRIGACGHTGHSTEPHLHFHLQDSPDLFNGMGLPVRFSGLQVDGRDVDDAGLTAGNRVVSREETAPSRSAALSQESG